MLLLALSFLLAAPASPSALSGPPVVEGLVVDPSGAPVSGARVGSVESPDCSTLTAADGTFALSCAAEVEIVRVSAAGFQPAERRLERRGAAVTRVVLEPAGPTELVIVTATRTDRWTTSPAAPVSIVTAEDLAARPAVPLDDTLRAAPGFSLFRRTSSRVSNPTTQGASLRGLTASGASRALVLDNGVALNDPFGGWVAWTRVPQAAIERVEVVRGGASDLYGADALAGVVQVLTTRPTRPVLRGELSAAMHRTARASLFGGTAANGWDATLAGEASTTRGYVLVPKGERGRVDVPAGSRYATARAGAGYSGAGWYVRGAGGLFVEDRENGTALQTNDTEARHGRLDAGGELGGGHWRATLHASGQTYRQVFSAIAPDRSIETLTLQQRVPANERGVSGEWSRSSRSIDWLIGGDVRQTTATNHEQGYLPTGQPRPPTRTPAFQRTSGVFAQTALRPADRLTLTMGMRGDLREREREAPLSDADGRVSPRFVAAWTATSALVLRGSVGWSFRAPTLNERYRGFRVGNVETQPNAALEPERLRTIEAGGYLAHGPASLRITVFRSDLTDAIANVTIASTPTLITRRRENVGGVRVWGAEVEGSWAIDKATSLTAAAALMDSRFADDPALSGNRVPQVPAWQLSGGVRHGLTRAGTLAAQIRAFGRQFEDDRNTLTLGRGAVLDVALIRPLGGGASLLLGVENLLNMDYDVGRTPTRTVGQPLTVHASVRMAR